MDIEVKEIATKHIVGIHVRTSMQNDVTYKAWQAFMPRRREVANAIGTHLISMQVFDEPVTAANNSDKEVFFDNWAAVEVANLSQVPQGMEGYTIQGGKYAVFTHRGEDSKFFESINYFYTQWLPQSGYEVDDRAQFEILGEKYKTNHPESEEEVWIPLK